MCKLRGSEYSNSLFFRLAYVNYNFKYSGFLCYENQHKYAEKSVDMTAKQTLIRKMVIFSCTCVILEHTAFRGFSSKLAYVCVCVFKKGDSTDQETQKVSWHVNIINIP